MDHLLALRAEVSHLRQISDAQTNAINEVGEAIGLMYSQLSQVIAAMPQPQQQTYSQQFQQGTDDSDF